MCKELAKPGHVCRPMGLSDRELERILAVAREAGACSAGYLPLRLPHELKPLFRAWLDVHRPGCAEHVFSPMRQLRGGREYDSRFATRQRGSGSLTEIIAQGLGAAPPGAGGTDVSGFRPPPVSASPPPQMTLF